MYIPENYKVSDVSKQIELIKQNPFGILFGCATESNGVLGYLKGASPQLAMQATHIPFVIVEAENGKHKLLAHFAKKNMHAELLDKQENCLVVFQGPNCYVSSAWYPLKKKTHKFVPTWDYTAVHVYGKARIVRDNKEWLLQMLNAVVDQEEAKRPEGEEFEEKWKVSDAPEQYLDGMLKNIVGLEIDIDRIEAQVKAHQSNPMVNVEGVIENIGKEFGHKGKEVGQVIRDMNANR